MDLQLFPWMWFRKLTIQKSLTIQKRLWIWSRNFQQLVKETGLPMAPGFRPTNVDFTRGDGGGGVKARNSPGNLWLKRAGHGEQTSPGTI